MHEADLKGVLERSTDHEAWVAAIAAFFAEHELCYGHGATSADDEAYWLVRHLHAWDDAAWARGADRSAAAAAAALAARRVRERRPLAYLLHEAWFAGHAYFVDERVLVPRSPLAEPIERGLAPWLRLRPGDRVLDVGTGSGCIAIATALHNPGVAVDATDVSDAALEVAAINVERLGVADRVRLHRADLFPDEPTRYRAIIANPPYVPERDYGDLPPEYLHEPRIGLVGGRDGVELAARVLIEAVTRLTPDGGVFLEVGHWADALMLKFPRLELTWIELERGGEGVGFVAADELERGVGRDRRVG